jgi:hypothetical protein
MRLTLWTGSCDARRTFIGSDAPISLGDDQAALCRLWREKRGEVDAEDLCDNLRCPSAARSLPRWPLPQPDAWTPAVFVDEFDARSFQGAANSIVVGNCHGSLSIHKLSPSNRRHPYGRCVS